MSAWVGKEANEKQAQASANEKQAPAAQLSVLSPPSPSVSPSASPSRAPLPPASAPSMLLDLLSLGCAAVRAGIQASEKRRPFDMHSNRAWQSRQGGPAMPCVGHGSVLLPASLFCFVLTSVCVCVCCTYQSLLPLPPSSSWSSLLCFCLLYALCRQIAFCLSPFVPLCSLSLSLSVMHTHTHTLSVSSPCNCSPSLCPLS